jgi:hypothetical protein
LNVKDHDWNGEEQRKSSKGIREKEREREGRFKMLIRANAKVSNELEWTGRTKQSAGDRQTMAKEAQLADEQVKEKDKKWEKQKIQLGSS